MEKPANSENHAGLPELPKRTPGQSYIGQGITDLEDYVNDPRSHISPQAAEEIGYLDTLYNLPAMEPGYRNTRGLAAKASYKNNLSNRTSARTWRNRIIKLRVEIQRSDV